MINKLTSIIDNVNNYLHKGHGTGVFDTERMAATRTSNCFGRQAIIGSAIADTLPGTDVFLLVARNHGMPFVTPSGRKRLQLAHVESVIMHDSESYLLDTPPPYTLEANPSLRNLSDVTWPPEALTDTVRIVHHQNRHIDRLDGLFPESELTRLYGPPEVRALRHLFEVHPFEEGLEVYQRNASETVGQTYSAQDYLEFYRSTIVPATAEELESRNESNS